MLLISIIACFIVISSVSETKAQTCTPSCKAGYKCMINNCVLDVKCPKSARFGKGPPANCSAAKDPLNKPKSKLESWFTKDIFDDLFPKANIGWGPNKCHPYNYDSFVIAARYFPQFGTESVNNSYTAEQNQKRDLATFFAHAIQETGENDPSLYDGKDNDKSAACFYRGGFYNWFEGGPTSSFLPADKPGYDPIDGSSCNAAGLYCTSDPTNDYFYPCNKDKNGTMNKGCYFGRGSIQISYNFNYGMFQNWLKQQGIAVDLLKEPNLVVTKTDPPLAIMASLWFYMTPQPPKPAMHDIIMGNWQPGQSNSNANYKGPILGPTSLIINNECSGEEAAEPGSGGENRRIKAFKWFAKYFNVPIGDDKYLSCKNMPAKFGTIAHNLSYQVNWATTGNAESCDCVPASYGGPIPYYQKGFYPDRFVAENEINRKRCVQILYKNPSVYNLDKTSKCLGYPPK